MIYEIFKRAAYSHALGATSFRQRDYWYYVKQCIFLLVPINEVTADVILALRKLRKLMVAQILLNFF